MSRATIDLEKDKFNSLGEIKIAGAFGGGGSKTTYTQAQINTLSSSTDINDWIDAYNDGQLIKQFVQEYDGTSEKVTYYTHPSLTSGKCLKILRLYTDDNSNRVLQSETPSVADWNFEDDLLGDLTLTLGSVTSPPANAAAAVDVCSVILTDNYQATGTQAYRLELSGTNASLYRFHNVTRNITASTLIAGTGDYGLGDTVVVETASQWANVTYAHTISVVVTDDLRAQQLTQNFSTSGTAVFTNQNEFALSSQATTSNSTTDFQINGTEKSLWPSLGSGTNTFPTYTDTWSLSFWLYAPGVGRSNSSRTCLIKQQIGTAQGGIQIFMRGSPEIEMYITSTTANTYRTISSGSLTFDAWNHVIFTYNGSGIIRLYVDNGPSGSPTGTYPTALDNATINALELHTFVHTPAAGSTISRANDVCVLDELIAFNIELNATQRTELYNSGEWINPSDLSFASNVESYFKMGDGGNDSVANNQVYDEEDSSRYFEKVGTGTHGITQLTMNDTPYSSSSGNHKYIQSGAEWTLTGGDVNGNTMPTGRIGAYQNTDSTKHLFGGANANGEFSVSFWINSSGTPSPSYAGHTFFNTVLINNSNTTESVKFGVMQYINNYLYTNIAGVIYDANYYTGALTHNVWRHVVVTFENSATAGYYVEKMYVDGTHVGGGTANLPKTGVPYLYDMTGYTNYGFAVGSAYDDNASHAPYSAANTTAMRMDEFATFSKALSQSEITAIYNNGSPGDLTGHSGIEHWFRMGDGDNDTGTSIACVFHSSTTLTSTTDYTQNH